MQKSHSAYLLGLYDALLLKDCTRAFPALSKELGRDFQRLVSSVNTRGLRVLTIDLPAFGKEFDFSLHEERLTFSPTFLTGRLRKGSPFPRLFVGLMKRVFDADGTLSDHPCEVAIRFIRQASNLCKKWKAPCRNTYTFSEVREFFRVDSEVRTPSLLWREPYLNVEDAEGLTIFGVDDYKDAQLSLFEGVSGYVPLEMINLAITCQKVFDVMSVTLGRFDPGEHLAKHGPGVVSDLARGNSKYEFPAWPERLEVVFQSARFAFANYGLWADYVRSASDDSDESVVKPNPFGLSRFEGVEVPSRLIAVPKTHKGPRLIAAEPTANQWCQQIVRHYMYDRTHQTWLSGCISFRDQSFNQRSALAASRDSSHATIDLSAASDRISCWLVERAFRKNPFLLQALHACRTFIIRNPIDKKRSEFKYLNKFSTMGSAVTFPVQSLLFACMAIAALHFVDGKRSPTQASCKRLAREVRVFGDDIIVPERGTGCTKALLEYLGFKVNTSKTYSGPSRFRESCGVEAYAGVDVTPAYALMSPVRSSPDSLVSLVASSHNFFNKGLYDCAAYLRRTTTKVWSDPLPWVKTGSGVFGWPSPFGLDFSNCKVRWNTKLWRLEYLARSVLYRVTKQPDRGPSRLLQYFTEAPKPEINWSSGVAVKGRVLTRPTWHPVPYINQ